MSEKKSTESSRRFQKVPEGQAHTENIIIGLACSYSSLHAVSVACMQFLKVPEGSLKFLKVPVCSFMNLFESFVLSSSQELRSACLF